MAADPDSLISLLIGRLDVGGAERQFTRLALGLAARGHRVDFLTLFRGGPLAAELEGVAGIRLLPLYQGTFQDVIQRNKLRRNFLYWRASRRLLGYLRECRPEVLYSSMFTTNFLAAWRGRQGGVPVVWGMRTADPRVMEYEGFPIRMCQRTAKRVDRVISNSRSGLELLDQLGCVKCPGDVVPNGIDAERFHPDAGHRNSFRQTHRVGDEELLVGIVGRPQDLKGHDDFLAAMKILIDAGLPLRPVLVLPDFQDPGMQRIRSLAEEAGIAKRLLWIEGGNAVEKIYPGLDFLCSSSWAEGLSNVIAEAMACALPVVATAVGDSADLVADTGSVVPPRDPVAMAAALRALIEAGPEHMQQLGARARQRIVQDYSVARMVERTEQILREVAAPPRGA